MSVAQILRKAREDKGLSQEALARLADVSVSTVIRIEGDKLMPLASSLFALARVLEVDLSALSEAVLQPA